MAISINWGTRVISIPKADLTLVGGTLYELDTDVFRLALKALESSEDGASFPDTHRHNTEVTVAGTTFARTLEIINGYSITFEDGQYTVRLAGSNNNFFDVENSVLNQNQVSIIAQNSAGLITTVQGSGVLLQDITDIAIASAEAVWNTTDVEVSGPSSITAREALRVMLASLSGKVSGAAGTTITFRDALDHKDRIIADVDIDGNRTSVTLDLSD